MAVTIATASTTGYSDTNCDSTQLMGQSFEVANTADLTTLKISMKKNGSPTGSFQFEIYAHSGTYGTSSVPTGTPLATSDSFNTATLTTSYVEYTVAFSGANQISMTSGERYVLVCNYANTAWTNAVMFQNKTPSFYSGNQSYKSGGSWAALAAYDVAFTLEGLVASVKKKLGMFALIEKA